MNHAIRHLLVLVAGLGCLSSPLLLLAQQVDPEKVLAPIIAFEARVPENARTASILGSIRRGTGIVIDTAGLVVTIGYLILEANAITLYPHGPDTKGVAADVIGWDEVTGLGLLRAREPLDVPAMPLGDSAAIRPGQLAMAVSWHGVEGMQPVTIVGPRAYIGFWEYLLEDAIFATPMHPAFAGAALVGGDGRLLGIGGFAHQDVFNGRALTGNVFVPVDAFKGVLGDLLVGGRSASPRAWLGLYCTEEAGRLRVQRVPDTSPAAKAGVKAGDVVLELNGVQVDSLAGLYRTLWSTARPGDRIALELQRGGQPVSIKLKAENRYNYFLSWR